MKSWRILLFLLSPFFYSEVLIRSFKFLIRMREYAKENCEVLMFNKQNKILKFFYGQKPIKLQFIIFLGFEAIQKYPTQPKMER